MEVLQKNLSLNTVLITEGIRTEGYKAGNGSPNILQEKQTLYSTQLLFLLVLIWARWSPSSLGFLFNGNYLGNWSVIRKIVILFSVCRFKSSKFVSLFSSLLSFPFLLFFPLSRSFLCILSSQYRFFVFVTNFASLCPVTIVSMSLRFFFLLFKCNLLVLSFSSLQLHEPARYRRANASIRSTES